MTPSNTHPGTAARGLKRAFLQAASDLLAARARRRSADRARARPRLEGLEDRCLLSITEYPIPTAGSQPWAVATGSDGNAWFTEAKASQIGVINPTTHLITEFPTPTANAFPREMTAGPDGNLWFTEGGIGPGSGGPTLNLIGMINPTTHAISEFSTPTSSSEPFGITAGPDGNLWFTEMNVNKIAVINPTTDAVSEFPIPTAGSSPRYICAGPDGNLWFTEMFASRIGMINATTHVITEFPIPYAGALPMGIAAGPDGNVWFTDIHTGQVGVINLTSHAITEFPVPAGSPNRITAGPDGNVWFTESAGKIANINPATQVVTEFPVAYAGSSPAGITTGPDGNLWFTDYNNSIGVFVQNPDHFVVTQQPPSSLTAGSPFGLTVQAEDRSGNPDPSFNGTVTVALANNPAGDTLGGTLTVIATGGVATFSGLTLTRAASGDTLQASAGSVDSATTGAITVTPAAATQLVITQQPPSTVKVSTRFTMKASIEDTYGNVVTTASGPVSVAFANNPTGATLGGTLTVSPSQGVASFSNLTINKIGTGYSLRVSSSGLISATSNPIDVTKNGRAPSTLLASAPAGSPAADLSLAPLVLDSPDLWDGLHFKKRPRSI